MDVTQRFTDRVADYVRYRPDYPAALADWLTELGLGPGSDVADVGAGTGIFSRMLLELGANVALVEPNGPMFDAARSSLEDAPNATFIDGRAEATTLADNSMDWVTCAQAFHWFDPDPTRVEFSRILRPDGRVALIWNDRAVETDGLMGELEALLAKWGTDFGETTFRRRSLDDTVAPLLGVDYEKRRFAHFQTLAADGFVGRVYSSSYMPSVDDPNYGPSRTDIEALFDRHAVAREVTLVYDTFAFVGVIR